MTTIAISIEAARTLLMLGAIHGTGRNERVAVNELTRALRGVTGAKAEPVRRPRASSNKELAEAARQRITEERRAREALAPATAT